MNQRSICAIVVTYNRKTLLIECLSALEKQTYPVDAIYIVNNASTDGTELLLQEQGWLSKDHIHLYNLKENIGGAGGFSFGVEKAFNDGFDYIWLMDDDGYPLEDCLNELIKNSNKNTYLGPLVLDKDEPSTLCFPMRLPKSLLTISSLADLNKLGKMDTIEGIVIPFNGILFSSDLVRNIGIPKKEYFIWGDDFEYTKRAEKSGARIATINNAKFYHPKDKLLGTPMFFGKLKFNDTPSRLKLYCMCRNSVVNHMVYSDKIHVIAFILKLMWFYLFTKPNLSKLFLSLRAVWHGFKKDFSHHTEYL